MSGFAENVAPAPQADLALARQKASGSSFYAAMRLLPRAERDAMFAIYAFCRAVDDIADDGLGTRAERHAQLQSWRDDLAALYAGKAPSHTQFLNDAVARFGLKQDDFLAVIDGMDMDAAEDIRAPDWNTLDLYCDRVASAVGRLSVRVFGMEEKPGIETAYHLGRALQLTNILRDVDEDAGIGRLYLPREALAEAGITGDDPETVLRHAAIDKTCRIVAARARIHYRGVSDILATRPRGLLRAPRLMAAVYERILDKMERIGWAPPRARTRVSKVELIGILLRRGLTA